MHIAPELIAATLIQDLDADQKDWRWPWVLIARGLGEPKVATFHDQDRLAKAAAWIEERWREGCEIDLMLGDVARVLSRQPLHCDLHGVRNIAIEIDDAKALSAFRPKPFAAFRGENGFVAVWRLLRGIGVSAAEDLSRQIAQRFGGRPMWRYGEAPFIYERCYPALPLAREAESFAVWLYKGCARPMTSPISMLRLLGAANPAPRLIAGPATVGAPTASASPSEDVSVSLDAIEAAPVDWLWPHRIARKKLHLIGGEPGKGKSQLCAFLAARVTRGGAWPCGAGEARRGGGVLWFGSEEDPAEEIKPRLLAAGADVRRVRALRKGWRILGGIGELDREADVLGGDVRLLVLDPINAAAGSGVGTNDKLREEVLSRLLAWAARRNAAVVGILHPPKNAGGNPASMFGGLKAYFEVARVVLFAASDPEARDRGLLLLSKANGVPIEEKAGHAYRFKSAELPGGITAPYVAFEPQRINLTVDDLLAGRPPEPVGYPDDEDEQAADAEEIAAKPEKRKPVVDWLREELAAGPKNAARLKEAARQAGYLSNDTLYAAARALGVVRAPREEFGGAMTWSLPNV